jgi:hypothetical protein
MNPALSFISKAELETLRKRPVDEIIKIDAHAIADWSDYSFTGEGRTFRLFLDGEAIGHRLAARGTLGMDPAERKNELNEIAGFILEADSEQPPLIFKEQNLLVDAWAELHRSFDVPLSADECAALDIEEPSDDEDEE